MSQRFIYIRCAALPATCADSAACSPASAKTGMAAAIRKLPAAHSGFSRATTQASALIPRLMPGEPRVISAELVHIVHSVNERHYWFTAKVRMDRHLEQGV